MFEHAIAHAERMIERLRRCHREGSANVPADVPVAESELSAWYAGVYDAFVEQFGKDSKAFAHFEQVRDDAQHHITRWRSGLLQPDTQDDPPEPAYIRYLQTMSGLLAGYANTQPRAPGLHP